MYGTRTLVGFLATWCGLFPNGPTIVRAAAGEEGFYKAYYLERERGDAAGAAELYAKVVASSDAGRGVRDEAGRRLAALREAAASADLAALMPSNTIVYVELSAPGDRVIQLLNGLGLLAEDGAASPAGERRVAVSPRLVKGLLGVGGAAVAITGIDLAGGVPAGVAVFDPGDMEVVRGFIETGLPIGGAAVESIGGFATYQVEGQAFVTLTSRLVVISPQKALIADVLKRLEGKAGESLATSGSFVRTTFEREDSLLSFFINAAPIMPMLDPVLAGQATGNHEIAMARALFDFKSLQCVVGNVGVGDDGLSLELALQLEEGHRNLVFNFMRTPAVSREALRYVPADAAAVFMAGLNEAASRYSAAPAERGEGAPVISALDFGRELFANIIGVTVFAMPTGGEVRPGEMALPDAAAVLHVHDVVKSEALWRQMLGIASVAAGASSMEGRSMEIDGIGVHAFPMRGGPTVFLATDEQVVLVAITESAMRATLASKRGGKSIERDAAYAQAIERIGPDTSKALLVHAGRLGRMLRPFMPEGDAAEAAPFIEALSETLLTLAVTHSNRALRLEAQITGMPKLGGIVTQMVEREMSRERRSEAMQRAMRGGRWDEVVAHADEALTERPGNAGLLRAKFDALALGRRDRAAAEACADQLFAAIEGNATALNNFAWALLTEERYGSGYAELAVKFSERSNERTAFKNAAFLDTLALARFESGAIEEAVAIERKAVELADGGLEDDLRATLARFEAALAERHLQASSGAAGAVEEHAALADGD